MLIDAAGWDGEFGDGGEGKVGIRYSVTSGPVAVAQLFPRLGNDVTSSMVRRYVISPRFSFH